MRIVLIHGQNHKGSSYHIGKMIADTISGKKRGIRIFPAKGFESFLSWLLSVY